MKTVVLYANTKTPECPERLHHIIVKGKPIYIRAEVVDADLIEALDHANPHEDEVVLNSIEFET